MLQGTVTCPRCGKSRTYTIDTEAVKITHACEKDPLGVTIYRDGRPLEPGDFHFRFTPPRPTF